MPSSRPRYLQIKEDIQFNIEEGHLRPGTQIPTEHELAKQYGVSRTTVRRALDELALMGFVVRQQGSGTFVAEQWSGCKARGNLLYMIMPDMRSALPSSILVAAERAAQKEGYDLVFAHSDEDPRRERACVERAIEVGADGIALFPIGAQDSYATVELANRRGIPLVLVDRYLPPLPNPYVVSDNVSGGYMAGTHLVELGHTKIAVVTTQFPFITSVADRLRGFHQALHETGLVLPPEYILLHRTVQMGQMQAGRFSEGGDLRRLIEFLAGRDRPTAVFAVNDLIAIDVMLAIRRCGLTVPGDLAVVGYDNSPICETVSPSLTSVAQSGRCLGQSAIRLLVSLVRQEKADPLVVPVELVARESTGSGEKARVV